jgi:hypothetical protein
VWRGQLPCASALLRAEAAAAARNLLPRPRLPAAACCSMPCSRTCQPLPRQLQCANAVLLPAVPNLLPMPSARAALTCCQMSCCSASLRHVLHCVAPFARVGRPAPTPGCQFGTSSTHQAGRQAVQAGGTPHTCTWACCTCSCPGWTCAGGRGSRSFPRACACTSPAGFGKRGSGAVRQRGRERAAAAAAAAAEAGAGRGLLQCGCARPAYQLGCQSLAAAAAVMPARPMATSGSCMRPAPGCQRSIPMPCQPLQAALGCSVLRGCPRPAATRPCGRTW